MTINFKGKVKIYKEFKNKGFYFSFLYLWKQQQKTEYKKFENEFKMAKFIMYRVTS